MQHQTFPTGDAHPTPEQAVQLRDELRALGYKASLANGACFDIHQEGRTHYLSWREACDLRASPHEHPLVLDNFGERRGLNTWYNFSTCLRIGSVPRE